MVNVDILTLLTGSPTTLADLQQQGGRILAGQMELREEVQQGFELLMSQLTRQWNRLMNEDKAECPNLFIIQAVQLATFDPRQWFTYRYRLHLLCQDPTCPHPISGDEGYELQQPQAWWAEAGPWLGHVLTALKYTQTLGKIGGLAEDILDQLETSGDLLEKINDHLPVFEHNEAFHLARDHESKPRDPIEVSGHALRVWHSLLTQLDPRQHWAGLTKTLTPDGNILWLCDQHRREYSR